MQRPVASPKPRIPDDVRYIGALAGCYALSDRRDEAGESIPVFACRMQSITPYQAVLLATEIPRIGETVAAHFKDFGLIRAHATRIIPTGFVIEFTMDDAQREKLAAKIMWRKKTGNAPEADKRDFPRILPRNPRTVLTMPDGKLLPCFVIDVSQSGVAVSAAVLPPKGTPLAVGSLIGRVVRKLDVGFAVQFLENQPFEYLERMLLEPPGSAERIKAEMEPAEPVGSVSEAG